MTTEDQKSESTSSSESPAWFIDEGVPGQGDRPNWLPEKFKTVADMARSNAELEKKLGTPAEEYDFKKSKFLDPDYVPFQELEKLAKEKRIPKEYVDKMIESIDKFVDEFSTDPQEEIKKLGDNAHERLKTLENWANANLSKDSYDALFSNLKNAESIKALEELRGKMMSNTVQVPTNNGSISQPVTIKDLQKELASNIEKYETDEAYRKDIQNRIAIAAKVDSQGYIDKTGA